MNLKVGDMLSQIWVLQRKS